MIQPEKEDKFESSDLPKILAALHKAKNAKVPGKVTIDFAANGGVVSIFVDLKERFK